jgi:glycosyltransferase involved in cell wall biosynthesis
MQMYPGELSAATDDDLLDVEWYQRMDAFALTAELTACSEMVIAHSDHALEILKRDLRGGTLPPHIVVPLAVPRLPHPARPRATGERPLLASFGIVHPVKSPELLIEAVALMRNECPVDLALVGPLEDDYRDQLQSVARDAGVADRVQITGRLPYNEYVAWLHRAYCAVQLRRIAHGESSASIGDCIAAGVPVLTNSPTYLDMGGGFVRDLPRDVGAEQIAREVTALIKDPRQHEALRAAGKAYAEKCTIPRVVDGIFDAAGVLWR